MKKILFAVVLGLSIPASAGPYECERRCDKESLVCADECEEKYGRGTNQEWYCSNACVRQQQRCREKCSE